MLDIVSWLAEQSWGIVTGVIISLIVYFIVTFLPIKEDIRYKAIFYRRKVSKLIFNPTIKVSHTIKTQNLENKKMKLDDFVNKVREKLIQNNFVFKSERGNTTIFNYTLGKTKVEIMLTPSYIVEEDDEKEPIVDYLQCEFRLIESKLSLIHI